MKTGRDGLSIDLEPTTDVLAALSPLRRPGQTLVGFAAEHGEGGVERGRGKLERKGLDAVVVNDIARAGHRIRHRRERGHDRDRGRRAAGAAGPQGGRGRGHPRRRRAPASGNGGVFYR